MPRIELGTFLGILGFGMMIFGVLVYFFYTPFKGTIYPWLIGFVGWVIMCGGMGTDDKSLMFGMWGLGLLFFTPLLYFGYPPLQGTSYPWLMGITGLAFFALGAAIPSSKKESSIMKKIMEVISAGDTLHTPTGTPFTITAISYDDVTINKWYKGKPIVISRRCFEKIPRFLNKKGWVEIQAIHDKPGKPDTLDWYCKKFTHEISVGSYIAPILEKAKILRIDRSTPNKVLLIEEVAISKSDLIEVSEPSPNSVPSVTIGEMPQYVKEIEKYRNAISVLDSQFATRQVSEESYRMAKASLEKKLQDLLKLKEDVTRIKKQILELIEREGTIGKADILRNFDVSSEIVDEAFRQLENEGIIEETSGKRYRYKGITRQCPYCRRSIPADLPVCPLCGAVIE